MLKPTKDSTPQYRCGLTLQVMPVYLRQLFKNSPAEPQPPTTLVPKPNFNPLKLKLV